MLDLPDDQMHNVEIKQSRYFIHSASDCVKAALENRERIEVLNTALAANKFHIASLDLLNKIIEKGNGKPWKIFGIINTGIIKDMSKNIQEINVYFSEVKKYLADTKDIIEGNYEKSKEVVPLYEKKADLVLNLKDPDFTPDMVSDDFLARLKFNFEKLTKQAQQEFDIINKKQKEYEQQVKTLLEFEDKIKAYNGANTLASFVDLKNETEKVLDNSKTNQFKR